MGAVSDIYNQWTYIRYTLRSSKGRTPFNSGRSLPGTPVRERFTPTDTTVSSRPGLRAKASPSDLALVQAGCLAKLENKGSLDVRPRPNNARGIRLPSYLVPSNVRLSTMTSVATTVLPKL